jgi:CarD family transcriptional regulator
MAKTATSTKRGGKKASDKPARKAVRAQAASATKGAKRKNPPPKIEAKRSAKPVAAAAKPIKKVPVAVSKTPPVKAAGKVPADAKTALKPAPVAGKTLLPKGFAIKQAIAAAAQQAAPAGVRTMPAAVAKLAGQKMIAPAGKLPIGKPAVAAAAATTAATAAAAAANKKPVHQRHGFKTSEWIVYPAHGVGRIVAIEEQDIAGISLELFVITFDKDKMTLRVPTGKSASVGMRKLAEEGTVKRAMETLKGRARVKRTMWSRRAQEYEAKINSGDLIAIAEVVRDLYRSESQPEQSYSERQLYEAALDRMAREIAAVEKLDERGAVQRITEVLSKSAKGRRVAAEEAEIQAA